MKKFLTAAIIAGTAISAHAIDISRCEKFGENGEQGDWIVKCEPTAELRQIQSGNAQCLFLSAATDHFDDMLTDTDHIYVNVVPEVSGTAIIEYRVMQNTTFDYANPQPYAVCTE